MIMKDVVKVAVIGLGGRGLGLLKSCLLNMSEDVEVVAVCDNYQDRTDAGKQAVMKSKRGNVPFASTNYKEVIGRKEVDYCHVVGGPCQDCHRSDATWEVGRDGGRRGIHRARLL
jgi:predicted dehydrogenase